MDTTNTETSSRSRVAALAASIPPSLAAGVVSGAAAGLVWGGIGGRIAMRITFLTSSDSVRGITSDDGFEIGVISGETVALLIVTTVFGAIAGALVGLSRPFLAGRTLPTATGVGVSAALAVGAGIVHSDGVDFVFLDPLWLTVGLFVLLPGAWGATVVIGIDRLAPKLRTMPPQAVPWRWMVMAAWATVGALAVLGAVDLVDDVRELTRLR